MKKSVICSFFILILVTIGYIYSYERAAGRLRGESSYEAQEIASAPKTVKSTAHLIVETYDIKAGKNERKITAMPAAYLGLTREGVLVQLEHFMDNMSVADMENGLVSFELMYFSPECLILRKTYSPPENFQKFYVKLNKGCVTVYYSDRKTVYDYTDIDFSELPYDLAVSIFYGMEVRDEKELYDLLENYTS